MKKLLSLTILMFICAFICRAETITVSPEGMSLTQALAICSDGDTIELSEGVYSAETEEFPLVISKSITLTAAENASAVIESPKMVTAISIEADNVAVKGIDIRFLRNAMMLHGNDLTIEGCTFTLADEKWRVSSSGIWCSASYRLTMRDCAFYGCGLTFVGPALSESSKGFPVLTGLYEVGEDQNYFVTHTIENCTVNDRPLYYIASQENVVVPEGMGEIIVCGCDGVTIDGADVSGSSMGMVLLYNKNMSITNSVASKCGLFGIYTAKCENCIIKDCYSSETNHSFDIRACDYFSLINCDVDDSEQGIFLSWVNDSQVTGADINNTKQGYFLSGCNGITIYDSSITDCENGMHLEITGRTAVTGVTFTRCTVTGLRIESTPASIIGNTFKDCWVGIIAYGHESFDAVNNTFDGSGSCGIYLHNVAKSNICRNIFINSKKNCLEAAGDMNGSVWADNLTDGAIVLKNITSDFGIMR